jgi:hypothetical protein
MQRVLRSDQFIWIGVLRHLVWCDSELEMADALMALYPKLILPQIDIDIDTVLILQTRSIWSSVKYKLTVQPEPK